MSLARNGLLLLSMCCMLCWSLQADTPASPSYADANANLVRSDSEVMWWMLSWLIWASLQMLKLIVWTVICALFALWWFQGKLLYRPSVDGRYGRERGIAYNQPGYRMPSEQGLPFEEHYLETEDKQSIHVWLIPNSQCIKDAPTLIFFHGNAGNIGYHLPNMKYMWQYTGANILLVEYRGYGNSSGSPSEDGLIYDAEAALHFVHGREDMDSSKVFVMGWSLGGAVSIALTHQQEERIRGLIVENTFTSLTDMVMVLAQKIHPFKRGRGLLRFFLRFYLSNPWLSKERVSELTLPVLYISGLRDELIPPAQMQALHDATTKSCARSMFAVRDGGHDSTFIKGGEAYFESIRTFIYKHCATR